MTTQNWPQDPLVPSTTGNEASTSDLSTTELGTSKSGKTSDSRGSASGPTDSKSAAAKDSAKQVGDDGKKAAKNVAGTAASEAKDVAAEAGSQAKNLLSTVTSEVKNQAGSQQGKVTEGLRGISDELKSMADKSDNGMVSGLVQQASDRGHTAADWLEGRDASEVLDDVKSFARRKPGTFLALAAGAGLVVGRLTRGAAANRSSDSSDNSSTGSARSQQGTDRSRSTGTGAGYTEVDADAYSGTPATAGHQDTTGRGIGDTNPAMIDPTDDYPTIPPGTPPVGTRPGNGGLR